MSTSLRPVIAVVLLAACQEPFPRDRHDLVGDRVAAVTLAARDGGVAPTAWLVVDGKVWSDTAVELAWWQLDPGARLEPQLAARAAEAPDAVGPSARLDVSPSAAGALGLRATFPSGHVSDVLVSWDDGAIGALPGLTDLTLGVVTGRSATEPTEDELALEVRREDAVEPAVSVPEDRWARLGAVFAGTDGAPEALTSVRWMATGGTFLEVDALHTDWAPADLVLDDLEVESAEPLGDGAVTVFALAVDGRGGQVLRARDVWVGEPAGPGVVVDGRWLGVDADVSGASRVRGVLVTDDTAPSGMRLSGVEVVTEALPAIDPYGTGTLACVGVSGAFTPDWLATGRCVRDDVVRRVVVVEVE